MASVAFRANAAFIEPIEDMSLGHAGCEVGIERTRLGSIADSKSSCVIAAAIGASAQEQASDRN